MSERKLDNWIDGFMTFTNNTEPPRLFKLWTAVGVVAGCLQRKCKLEWGLEVLYPNMYIVLVAPSGRARKGTALGVGYNLLRKAGVKMAAEAITREALIRELAAANDMDIDPVTKKMTFHCSLTIFSPELTVFLGYSNLQLLSDLTDWFDCRDRWTYRTKNVGTDEINGVWVNLIGATTPELIQTSLPQTAIGGGLTSRIIFVYEENKGKLVPLPFLEPGALELGESLLHDLQNILGMRGDFRIPKTVARRYAEWYVEQERNPPFENPYFQGYVSRRPTHLRKLMMIMSAARGTDLLITDDDFDRSVTLLTDTETKMVHTFAGVGRDRQADVVDNIMKFIAVNSPTDMQALLWRFRFDANRKFVDDMLSTLVGMKFCKITVVGGKQIITHLPTKREGEPVVDLMPAVEEGKEDDTKTV